MSYNDDKIRLICQKYYMPIWVSKVSLGILFFFNLSNLLDRADLGLLSCLIQLANRPSGSQANPATLLPLVGRPVHSRSQGIWTPLL